MTLNISLLGSTGSIGTNVLDVVRQYPGKFRIVGLAAGNNVDLLRDQVEAFNPQLVSVATQARAVKLLEMLGPKWQDKIVHGRQGAIAVATLAEAATVVSAIVGAAGLMPTLSAIEAGKNIGLANKETLVMAGDLVMAAARKTRSMSYPLTANIMPSFRPWPPASVRMSIKLFSRPQVAPSMKKAWKSCGVFHRTRPWPTQTGRWAEKFPSIPLP